MLQETFELDNASALQTVDAVKLRHVSALEVCDAAIGRIELRDGPINAIVVRDFDRAIEAAKALDNAWVANDPRPLLGLSMTVKESNDVAGLPSSWGFPNTSRKSVEIDSVAVQRLKTAGAIILGKSNISTALADWQADSPVYGKTQNPYDENCTPGGSSGGAAAAIATGMIPLELGSDIGGSVRIPAHMCGVFGHKSTFGIIPMKGHEYPGSDGTPPELAVLGPLARTAADLALALGVLANQRSLLPAPKKPLHDYRVLVLDEHPAAATDIEVSGPLNNLAENLETRGVGVVRHVSGMPDLAEAHADYWQMLLTIMFENMPSDTSIDNHRWAELKDRQMRCARQWAAVFDHVDVVLSPPFGVAAFPHQNNPDWSARRLKINGEDAPYGPQVAWPGVATFPRLPATAAPIGYSKSGLPIGMQIIGAPNCDYILTSPN